MKHEFEITKDFPASKQDVLAVLHDVRKFWEAGGDVEMDSISQDADGKWHAQAKASIPLLPKPEFTTTVEPTPDGAHFEADVGMGIHMSHFWTVEEIGPKETKATEKSIMEAPMAAFHAVKMAIPGNREKGMQHLQEYFAKQNA